MLDARLSLAASLYEPCDWGADIGTDHAFLPCHLLRAGICQHMIAADVSPKALKHARENITHAGLTGRTDIVHADGLDALTHRCGCVSIMGMGGETMAEILQKGQARLQGAVLVLSAHTEQALVRETLRDIGYRITQERLCQAAGRYYVLWRAEPGTMHWTADELRYGRYLWNEDAALLRGFCAFRTRVLMTQLQGLQRAAVPDEAAIQQVSAAVTFYQNKLEA
ncbi:MAG: SAM-dependent methyltransferase [Clostridia bacterium]|nr:SAM-dependent methyltransferase [Clostridia bacterium]